MYDCLACDVQVSAPDTFCEKCLAIKDHPDFIPGQTGVFNGPIFYFSDTHQIDRVENGTVYLKNNLPPPPHESEATGAPDVLTNHEPGGEVGT